jgi:ankyrin repeat protein
MKSILVFLLLFTCLSIQAAELTSTQRLIIACYKLQINSVVKCLRNGANVNGRFGKQAYDRIEFYDLWTGAYPSGGADLWTPLLALANSPEYPDPSEELRMILKNNPEKSDFYKKKVSIKQIKKRQEDSIVILYILLSNKCNMNDDDGNGATALYEAAYNEKIQLVKILLQYGANPNTKTGVYIDGPGDVTPLHVACKSKEIIKLLLENGANANARDTNGRTPSDWIKLNPDRKYDLIKTKNGWEVIPKVNE